MHLINPSTYLYIIGVPQVFHFHVHLIPKPSASNESGLGIEWPRVEISPEELKEIQKELLAKL
jgi:diadenosine tetraphosphate (Ap4A) HIT family hydrolase